jgi:hypothetical protein
MDINKATNLVGQPTPEQRIAELEAALRATVETAEAGRFSDTELRIQIFEIAKAALAQPGEIPLYGGVLPYFVQAHSEGKQIFRVLKNAETFRDMILRRYPAEGYGTGVSITAEAGYYAVEYTIHGAD